MITGNERDDTARPIAGPSGVAATHPSCQPWRSEGEPESFLGRSVGGLGFELA
jgi:hypothetical protein